jgi:hypothetical protein
MLRRSSRISNRYPQILVDDVMNILREDPVVSLLLSLTCMQFKAKCEWTSEFTKLVVRSCALEVLTSLHIYSNILAAKCGRLDLMQWIIRFKPGKSIWSADVCAYAAGGGHLSILKCARKHGCPWDKSVCSFAAKGGHLEVLKWLHENGCPWNELTCYYAASNGHLEVLKWLHENGCPWNELTCYYAACNGHLEVLKWLHKNGCPWDEWTCTVAAKNGHLKVLKWLYKNGCPGDQMMCAIVAAGDGHMEVANWLLRDDFANRACDGTDVNGH